MEEKLNENNKNNENIELNEVLSEKPTIVEEKEEEEEKEEKEKKETETETIEINEAEIDVTTTSIVETIDIIQKRLCIIVSKKNDIDWSLNQAQKNNLCNLWRPVVKKYYGKIPVELVCIIGTGIIIGGQLQYAKQYRK